MCGQVKKGKVMINFEKGSLVETLYNKEGKEIAGSNMPFDERDKPLVATSVMFRNLERELLTIVNATFQDVQQRDAQKAIVTSVLWDWWHRNNPTPLCVNDDLEDHCPSVK